MVSSQPRSKFLYSLQEGISMTSSASSKNVEEDVLEEESDGALEEVNSHIKSVFEILKSETIKVRKEMKAFDTMAKKLKHVHFSKTLKLNVGGQLFSTSLETMRKDPGKSARSIHVFLKSITCSNNPLEMWLIFRNIHFRRGCWNVSFLMRDSSAKSAGDVFSQFA